MIAIFHRLICSGGACAPASSISWTISSSAMRLVHHCARLGGRSFAGRYARNGDPKSRAPARPRFERQPASQLLGHEIEDDVQAKPGSSLAAPRGEERIEGMALAFLAHPDAVVGNEDLDLVVGLRPGLPCFDCNPAGAPVRKGMDHAIEKKVGQDLTVEAGIALTRDPHGN